jgi:hypothetical protein
MIAAKSERQAELLRLLTLTKRLQRGPGFYLRLQRSVPVNRDMRAMALLTGSRFTHVLPDERAGGAE